MRLSTLLLSLIASSVCVIAAPVESKTNVAAPPKAKVVDKSNSATSKKPNAVPKKTIPVVKKLPTDPVARAKLIAAGKRPVQPVPPDPKMVARATVHPVIRVAMAMDIAKHYGVDFDRTETMTKEFRDQTLELTDSILRSAAYGDSDCLSFIDRIKIKMYGRGDPETSAAGEARAEAWTVAARLAAEIDRENKLSSWRFIPRSVASLFNIGSSSKPSTPSTKTLTKPYKASTKPSTKLPAKSSKALTKQPIEASSSSSIHSKSLELVPIDSSSSSDSNTFSKTLHKNGSINSHGTKSIIAAASIVVAVILASVGYAVWNNRKHQSITNNTTNSILNPITISASSPVTIPINTIVPLN